MIRVELDRNSQRQFKRTAEEFERRIGRGGADSVIELSRSGARQLAQKVPPFGLSENIGQRFQGSIAKQVNRAVDAGNVDGTNGDAGAVHQSKRNQRGQVPRQLTTRGKFQRDPVSVRDKELLIDRKQAAAGIAKGGWIAAGMELTGKGFSGVGRWIMRHASRGRSSIRRQGLSTEVTLTNEVDWIDRLQKPAMVRSAMQAAYRNTIKQMQRILDRVKA